MAGIAIQLDIPEGTFEDDQDDDEKEMAIFGQDQGDDNFNDQGDDSFIQNQEVVTVEYIHVHGNALYVFPMLDEGVTEALVDDLQAAFNAWCAER